MATAMRGVVLALLACACCSACSRDPQPQPLARREPPPPPPGPIPGAADWASRVGQPPAPLDERPRGPATVLRAAVMSDEAEAVDDEVFVSRLVYRVRFEVPPAMRDHRGVVAAPAGELQLDVSMERLRARLIGPGWPVDEGTEIRLRADLPGVYLFDGTGGRSLGAGQLATWFEGHAAGVTRTSRVAVRREYGPPAPRPVPGDLVCALIAEWSGYPRQNLAYRCNEEALPPGFRVGPWIGELTAVVPMELPRRVLRADEADPPPAIAAQRARMLLDPETLVKLVPSRPLEQAGPAALTVENRTGTRAIVIVQGVAVGWIGAGEQLRIDGFTPGYYRVGAVRPLGGLRKRVRLVRIPGELVITPDED